MSRSTSSVILARLRFAARYASFHLVVSIAVALASSAVVFGLWYAAPYRQLLNVSGIFTLLLTVDVICGPLLTFIVGNPLKSQRERLLDFSLIGLVQIAALVYGLHSMWLGRPVILAFEVDRLVIVTALEVQKDGLPQAPTSLQRLSWWGVQQVSTRKSKSSEEFLQSIELGLQGISPAMLPQWWLSWDSAQSAINQHAKPVVELLMLRPKDNAVLQAAIDQTSLSAAQLRYLPMTSSKTKDWVALLDAQARIVGHAPVDGFTSRD